MSRLYMRGDHYDADLTNVSISGIGVGVEIQPQLITFKALHIIGSSQYSICDVKEYLDFLCGHKELLDTFRSLATCYKVSDVNRAFADALSGKNVKTVLVKG